MNYFLLPSVKTDGNEEAMLMKVYLFKLIDLFLLFRRVAFALYGDCTLG
jgi:hypothetical protein